MELRSFVQYKFLLFLQENLETNCTYILGTNEQNICHIPHENVRTYCRISIFEIAVNEPSIYDREKACEIRL